MSNIHQCHIITLGNVSKKEKWNIKYCLMIQNLPDSIIHKGLKYLDFSNEREAIRQLTRLDNNKYCHPFIPKHTHYNPGDKCKVCSCSFTHHQTNSFGKHSHSPQHFYHKPIDSDQRNIEQKAKEKYNRRNSLPNRKVTQVKVTTRQCLKCNTINCDNLISLKCKHTFCFKCLGEYFVQKNSDDNHTVCLINDCNCEIEKMMLDDLYTYCLDLEKKNQFQRVFKKEYTIGGISHERYDDNEERDLVLSLENYENDNPYRLRRPLPLFRLVDGLSPRNNAPQCSSCKHNIEITNNNLYKCPNCRFRICLSCGFRNPDNKHYINPLSHCFANKTRHTNCKCCCEIMSILLWILTLLLLLIFLLIALGLALIWPSLGICVIGVHFYKKLEYEITMPIYRFIQAITYIVLSIALLPFGYICVAGAIIAIPLVFFLGILHTLKDRLLHRNRSRFF